MRVGRAEVISLGASIYLGAWDINLSNGKVQGIIPVSLQEP